MKYTFCTLVLLGCAFGGAASAELVSIVNPSFEILPAGFPTITCGGPCAYTVGIAIPGWTATGDADFGQLIMGGFDGNPEASDGQVMAYSDGATLTQDVGSAVAGTTYTLGVDLLHRNDSNFAGTIAFLVGGVAEGTISGTDPGIAQWGTFNDTYTATAADDGETITIELNASGKQGDYDNVTLDATAAPEPATLAMLGSALVGIALVRRKRVI